MKVVARKRNYIKLIVVLLVVGLAGVLVFVAIEYRKKPSPKLWNEMQAEWLEEHKVKIPWDGESNYYGTYQGDVVVWFERGPLAVLTEKEVAGENFWWTSSFVIRTYHDGEFLILEEAYEEGWLTQRDVKTIAWKHQKNIEKTFSWMNETEE